MEAVCKAGDPDPVGFNGVHRHSCQNASELRKRDFHGTQSSQEDSLEKVVLELGPQGTRSGRAGQKGEDDRSFGLGGSVDRVQRTRSHPGTELSGPSCLLAQSWTLQFLRRN